MFRNLLALSVFLGVAATLGACSLNLQSKGSNGGAIMHAFHAGQFTAPQTTADAGSGQNCPLDEGGHPRCPTPPPPQNPPSQNPSQGPGAPVDIVGTCNLTVESLQGANQTQPLNVMLYDLGQNPTTVDISGWRQSRKIFPVPAGSIIAPPGSDLSSGTSFTNVATLSTAGIDPGHTYGVYACAATGVCWAPSANAGTQFYSNPQLVPAPTLHQIDIAEMTQLVSGNDLANGARVTLNLGCQLPVIIEDFLDPLALSITGGAISLSSAEGGVPFDMNNDHTKIQMAWPQGYGDGFLVRLRPGEGGITNGGQLFGTSTRLSDGSLASSGFQALAALDSNNDGKITPADAAFDQLYVWYNPHTDGSVAQPQDMALKSLADAGITAIDLAYRPSGEIDSYGNQTSYQSDIYFGARKGILFDVLLLYQ